ncbi:MAG: hypothetical protein J6T74_00960 [Clostridia bacterium]|nr:hypothetical protein [Clostridia bacterium]
MKVEFFVPLTIEHYKTRNFDQKAPVPNFNHDYIIEQIEAQRQNDLSEDDSEFYIKASRKIPPFRVELVHLIDKYNTKEYHFNDDEIEYLKEYKEYLIKENK